MNFAASKTPNNQNSALDEAIRAAKSQAEAMNRDTTSHTSAPLSAQAIINARYQSLSNPSNPNPTSPNTASATPSTPRANLSAREAINSGSIKPTELDRPKSASRLHRGFIQKSLESTRTSASAILKTNGDDKEAPVVKTSLKLGSDARPKKPTVTLPPNARMARAAKSVDRPTGKKILSKISRSKALESRSIDAQIILPESTSAKKQIAPTTSSVKKLSSKVSQIPITTKGSRKITIQSEDDTDIPKTTKRPVRKSLGISRKIAITGASEAASSSSAISAAGQAVPKTTRATRVKANSARRKVTDPQMLRPRSIINGGATPNRTRSQAPSHPSSTKNLNFSSAHTSQELKARLGNTTVSDLGVVEDYSDSSLPKSKEIDPASTNGLNARNLKNPKAHKAEDSRRTLGKQSPFFLKSVTVEKRPLSHETAGTGHVTTMPRGVQSSKNIQTKTSQLGTVRTVTSKSVFGKSDPRSKRKAKDVNPNLAIDHPTVIVPSNRRSSAPLAFLVVMTVLLGAAVGAAAYLCFFQ